MKVPRRIQIYKVTDMEFTLTTKVTWIFVFNINSDRKNRLETVKLYIVPLYLLSF